MSLYIASLNSGSNGNCYYVGNDRDAVLIDAGISCRETERRMRKLNLGMDKVRAIFISHEHIDHIKGIYVLSGKYNLPVYVTDDILKFSRVQLKPELKRLYKADETISIGALEVLPFVKQHDAADPHSFTVTCSGVTVGIFTDLGVVCQNLLTHFSNCHAAFLEANYDADMLDKGRYPIHLKQRIRGGKGHLSNMQALELFLNARSPYFTHLILAHLSAENNHPEIVQNLFAAHAGDIHITVAPRTESSGLYYITGITNTVTKRVFYKQATLF